MQHNDKLLFELGQQASAGVKTWAQATEEYNAATGMRLTRNGVRWRFKHTLNGKLKKDLSNSSVVKNSSDNTYASSIKYTAKDSSLEINKDTTTPAEKLQTEADILKELHYDADHWKLLSYTIGHWDTQSGDGTIKKLTTIKAKIAPIITSEITPEDCIKIANDLLKKNIKPLDIHYTDYDATDKWLDDNKLLELPGIELHLGKLAFTDETGQNYSSNIAKKRFDEITREIIKQQAVEKCGTCLVCIGNDFFNSDTQDNTTAKGTPQYNDTRWKHLFKQGLEMYTKLLLSLKNNFNRIEVRLQQGNHDYMSSFYLYTALQCYFTNDNKIKFSNDVKDVQVFEWGKCAIFYTHGDINLSRLIKSIPAEFYEVWGRTLFRELHLGHLHKEVVVDDNSGMITRRVGSPTGTDAWHYQERFIGSIQKYQTFVWNKNTGLQNIKYINFNNRDM